jgi:hypothetical protein
LPCRQAGLFQDQFQNRIVLMDSGPGAGMTERSVVPDSGSGAGMTKRGCHPEFISGSVSESIPESYRLNGFRPGGRNDKAGLNFSIHSLFPAYCLLSTVYCFLSPVYRLLSTPYSPDLMERTNG